jgi:ATP-dependent Clp protease protease subunit
MEKIIAEEKDNPSLAATAADLKALEQFEEGRNLLLLGDIDSAMAARLMLRMLLLDYQDPLSPITLYINSGGGEVQAGLQIIDTMSFIHAPVRTICVGIAASMASVILASGQAGKREIFPHAQVMVHQPLVFSQGGFATKQSDLEAESDRLKKKRMMLEGIYASHCPAALKAGDESKKIPPHNADYYHRLCQEDHYMSAEEAFEAGLVDKIIETSVK